MSEDPDSNTKGVIAFAKWSHPVTPGENYVEPPWVWPEGTDLDILEAWTVKVDEAARSSVGDAPYYRMFLFSSAYHPCLLLFIPSIATLEADGVSFRPHLYRYKFYLWPSWSGPTVATMGHAGNPTRADRPCTWRVPSKQRLFIRKTGLLPGRPNISTWAPYMGQEPNPCSASLLLLVAWGPCSACTCEPEICVNDQSGNNFIVIILNILNSYIARLRN